MEERIQEYASSGKKTLLEVKQRKSEVNMKKSSRQCWSSQPVSGIWTARCLNSPFLSVSYCRCENVKTCVRAFSLAQGENMTFSLDFCDCHVPGPWNPAQNKQVNHYCCCSGTVLHLCGSQDFSQGRPVLHQFWVLCWGYYSHALQRQLFLFLFQCHDVLLTYMLLFHVCVQTGTKAQAGNWAL